MSIEPRFEHGFLEALFESAGIGLGLVDRDLRYIRVNSSLAAINGASIEGHEGKLVREIIPELGELAEKLLTQVMESKQPLTLEMTGATPADVNADRQFRLSYHPVFDGEEVIGVGALVLEETEMMRSQREVLDQARSIFEGVLQQLVIVKLALEIKDVDRALETTDKALTAAKKLASSALPKVVPSNGAEPEEEQSTPGYI